MKVPTFRTKVHLQLQKLNAYRKEPYKKGEVHVFGVQCRNIVIVVKIIFNARPAQYYFVENQQLVDLNFHQIAEI